MIWFGVLAFLFLRNIKIRVGRWSVMAHKPGFPLFPSTTFTEYDIILLQFMLLISKVAIAVLFCLVLLYGVLLCWWHQKPSAMSKIQRKKEEDDHKRRNIFGMGVTDIVIAVGNAVFGIFVVFNSWIWLFAMVIGNSRCASEFYFCLMYHFFVSCLALH